MTEGRWLAFTTGVVAACVFTATPALAAWQTTRIENFGDAASETTSLVLNEGGRTFVSFTRGGDDLVWAKRTATGWDKTQVAGNGTFLACYESDGWAGPSAAFTSSGEPRIASACLAVGGGSPVKFTRRTARGWTTTTIGATPSGTGDASATSVEMVLTPRDKPYIVVASRIGTIVRFRQVNGDWRRQQLVAGSGLCCQTPTVDAALSPDGSLAVAWNSSAYGGAVSFAEFDAAGEVVSAIASVPLAGTEAFGRPSLTYIDGDPAIAFQQGSDVERVLVVSRRAGAVWPVGTVVDASSTLTGANPSLVVAGLWHIAYHDESDGDLRYAVSSDGSTWSSEAVATSGVQGDFPSLAVTLGGGVRISSYDHGDTALRYSSGP